MVRRVDGTGTIGAFAGTGHGGGGGDGSAPQRGDLSFPEDVTVAADGSVLIADTGNGRIRRAAVGLPGFGDAEFALPSEDGTEVFQFDRDGRHLRTVEALTGVVRWSFGYDGAGRLVSVTDGDGNRTDIVRDGNGAATAIKAPGDVRTELAVRGDGFLGSVTNPAGEAVALDYLPGGLLKTLTDARAQDRELHLRGRHGPAAHGHRQERRHRAAAARARARRLPGRAHLRRWARRRASARSTCRAAACAAGSSTRPAPRA